MAAAIGELVSEQGTGPVFVHSDPFRAAKLVDRSRNRDILLDSHLALLLAACGHRPVWMPAFNYDFPSTKNFDVSCDPSHVGPVPERFRVTVAQWRTEIPIFSVAGTGEAPRLTWDEQTDPFGEESLFARLVEADGVILYYGDTFHYNTVVHYAERLAGGPAYRYDKLFLGTVVRADGCISTGSLNYHVRPMGMGLDYDWPGIRRRAIEAGVCTRLESYPEILAAPAAALTRLLVEEMKRDPLALLDVGTRAWVEPRLQQLGRRFLLSDFEARAK